MLPRSGIERSDESRDSDLRERGFSFTPTTPLGKEFIGQLTGWEKEATCLRKQLMETGYLEHFIYSPFLWLEQQ